MGAVPGFDWTGLFDGPTQEVKTDVPVPLRVRGSTLTAQFWRWSDPDWVLVDQP